MITCSKSGHKTKSLRSSIRNCYSGHKITSCIIVLLEVISYGTTITRHISKQQDYLSFPRNALVEVYAKHEDPDVWLVKVTMASIMCVYYIM